MLITAVAFTGTARMRYHWPVCTQYIVGPLTVVSVRRFLACPQWYQMHVSHFSMRKPPHVHSCHKAVMMATESVCFQTDLRAVLNVSAHSQSATPTQRFTSAPLTKCSPTLQVDFRDHMFLIEIYLF